MSETSLTLLDRLQREPDPEAWERLVGIYAPLIGRWLAPSPFQAADQDDLVQEVLRIMVGKLPEFQRRREGSFRAWLRVVTANCVRAHWRSQKHRPMASGDSDFLRRLHELEDPASAMTRAWDVEHDRHVVRRALEMIGPQFEESSLLAFRKVVLEGQKASQAAADLGISVNAVLLAKSKILRKLRREIEGLI